MVARLDMLGGATRTGRNIQDLLNKYIFFALFLTLWIWVTYYSVVISHTDISMYVLP